MDNLNSDTDAINWPLNIRSVIEFQDSAGDLRLNGYETANAHYVRKLKQILSKDSTFEELKKELTEFVQDREMFGEYLDRRFNGDTFTYDL